MENKVNLFIRFFEWVEKKIRTPVGSGMVFFLIGGGISFLVSNERANNLKERIEELKADVQQSDEEIIFLKKTIVTSDQECTNKFILMSQAIEEIKNGTEKTKKISDKLADQEKKANAELKQINDKIKSKL